MATVAIFYVNIKHKYFKDKLHKLKTNSHLPKEFFFLQAIIPVATKNPETLLAKVSREIESSGSIHEGRGSGHVGKESSSPT